MGNKDNEVLMWGSCYNVGNVFFFVVGCLDLGI